MEILRPMTDGTISTVRKPVTRFFKRNLVTPGIAIFTYFHLMPFFPLIDRLLGLLGIGFSPLSSTSYGLFFFVGSLAVSQITSDAIVAASISHPGSLVELVKRLGLVTL